MTNEHLLARINAELPSGIDWRAGALSYVRAIFEKRTRAFYERYSCTKPLNSVGADDNWEPLLAECVHYLQNFVNMVALLKMPPASRWLDVACGGGWVSHYLARFGYKTFGFDVSDDMIELARKRLSEDPYLDLSPDSVRAMFASHDIERSPLPDHLHARFDVAVLESALHHFFDPIAALSYIGDALTDDGVAVIIEGENRTGPIKPEWLAVMREFDTLERPYPRVDLEAIFRAAGFEYYEFVAPINGWFSLRSPFAQNANVHLESIAAAMNMAICAKSPEPLHRLFGPDCRRDSPPESPLEPVRPKHQDSENRDAENRGAENRGLKSIVNWFREVR